MSLTGDIHTEIFLEDLHVYSSKGDVPKWQIEACLEGFTTSKHFHKNLVLYKDGSNLSLVLESRSAEFGLHSWISQLIWTHLRLAGYGVLL